MKVLLVIALLALGAVIFLSGSADPAGTPAAVPQPAAQSTGPIILAEPHIDPHLDESVSPQRREWITRDEAIYALMAAKNRTLQQVITSCPSAGFPVPNLYAYCDVIDGMSHYLISRQNGALTVQ